MNFGSVQAPDKGRDAGYPGLASLEWVQAHSAVPSATVCVPAADSLRVGARIVAEIRSRSAPTITYIAKVCPSRTRFGLY